ncbi:MULTISPECIES: hypothetical protein [Actinomycetes]
MRRFGAPHEIASAVVYLLSGSAAVGVDRLNSGPGSGSSWNRGPSGSRL